MPVAIVPILLALVFLGAPIGCAVPKPPATPAPRAAETAWMMPESPDDPPMWGIRGGIVVGLHPARIGLLGEDGGPRGLVRLGYESGGLHFVNFLVLTPLRGTLRNLRGRSSELVESSLDGGSGLVFTPYPEDADRGRDPAEPPPVNEVARLRTTGGAEELSFALRTEPYPDGETAFLVFRISENRPFEVEIQSFVIEGGDKLSAFVLSTTWGNVTRLRESYLNQGIVNARRLYSADYGDGFAPPTFWKAPFLPRNRAGDLLFVLGPDEARPWETQPYPHERRLLQYFRKARGTWSPELRAVVNGRTRYWKSRKEVPGGTAFENMALMEPFAQGQTVVWGFYPGDVTDLLSGRPASLSRKSISNP